MPGPTVEQIVDRAREIIRVRNYSRRTAKAYCGWIVRFLRFNRRRDPRTLDKDDITKFLTYLANQRKVSASTQNQAASALLFLCRRVLRKEIEKLLAGLAAIQDLAESNDRPEPADRGGLLASMFKEAVKYLP